MLRTFSTSSLTYASIPAQFARFLSDTVQLFFDLWFVASLQLLADVNTLSPYALPSPGSWLTKLRTRTSHNFMIWKFILDFYGMASLAPSLAGISVPDASS